MNLISATFSKVRFWMVRVLIVGEYLLGGALLITILALLWL